MATAVSRILRNALHKYQRFHRINLINERNPGTFPQLASWVDLWITRRSLSNLLKISMLRVKSLISVRQCRLVPIEFVSVCVWEWMRCVYQRDGKPLLQFCWVRHRQSDWGGSWPDYSQLAFHALCVPHYRHTHFLTQHPLTNKNTHTHSVGPWHQDHEVGHHTLNSRWSESLKASVRLSACRSPRLSRSFFLSPRLPSLSFYAFGFASVPAAAAADAPAHAAIQMEVRVELFCVSVKCVCSIWCS